MSEPPSRAEKLLALVLLSGAAVSVPFWVGRFLPFLDLPQHLAFSTILRHHGDPAWGIAPYFEAEWGEFTPYWVHYLIWHVLSFAVPLETAVRIHVTAYAVGLSLGAGALCAALGRPRQLGLLAAPLALNTNLYYGFAAYCTGVVALLFALAVLIRHLDRPTSRRAVALGILAVLLFFTHVQCLCFLLLAAGILALATPGPVRERIRAILPLVAAAIGLLAPWVYLSTTTRGSGERYFPDLARPRATYEANRLGALPEAIAGAFQDSSDLWLLGAWAAAVLTAGLATRAQGDGGDLQRRARILLPLLSFACYFILPFSIQGQWNINQRFAWLAALLLLPLVPGWTSWATALAVALSVSGGVNAAVHHRRFDREVGAFDEALAAIPPGRRVMTLILDAKGAVLTKWPYLHFGQYSIVRRGGMAAHSLARHAPLPVRQRPEARPPEQSVWRPQDFRFQSHAPFYEYFLIQGSSGARERLGSSSAVEPVFEKGGWSVYRNIEWRQTPSSPGG